MIFYAYIGLMGAAVGLSLFNLKRGDVRLTGLAVTFFCVVSGFHCVAMDYLGLQHTPEFPLYVAGAQGVIAFMAYEIGCRAAKIIMPIAWFAVLFNMFIYGISEYPSIVYFYTSNIIQCCEIASLIFASSIWHGYAYSHKKMARDFNNLMKRTSHERAG